MRSFIQISKFSGVHDEQLESVLKYGRFWLRVGLAVALPFVLLKFVYFSWQPFLAGWTILLMVSMLALSFHSHFGVGPRAALTGMALVCLTEAATIDIGAEATTTGGLGLVVLAILAIIAARGGRFAISVGSAYFLMIVVVPHVIEQHNIFAIVSDWLLWLGVVIGFTFIVGDGIAYYQNATLTAESTANAQHQAFARFAHQLRTPVSMIGMIIDNENDPEKAYRHIRTKTDQLTRMIDDIQLVSDADPDAETALTIFKMEELERDLDWQIENIAHTGEAAINLAASEFSQTLYVADFARIVSVSMNLIRNAVAHAHARHINVRLIPMDPVRPQMGLKIIVEDDGIGIPEDDRDRLLERYERGDTDTPGLGLGLYLTNRWLRAVGGELRFEEADQGGSRSTVILPTPLAPDEFEQKFVAEMENWGQSLLSDRRVLLIEDERLIRELGARLLTKRFNANVVTAEDGDDGLRLALLEDFDLIITDYFMPRMSGADMIRALRRKGISTPVIAATAATIGEEAHELIGAGADRVLSKPMSMLTLSSAVVDLRLKGRFQVPEDIEDPLRDVLASSSSD